jgi:membrane fusion protein
MQQTPSIYRSEAWQAHSMAQHGSAMLLPSNRIYFICGFLLVWVSALAGFLFNYSFTEKVAVSGYIVSDQPSIAIGPKENTGIVSQVFVQNGARVRQGQRLLSIKRPSQMLLGDAATKEQLALLGQQLSLMTLNQEQRINELSAQQKHILIQIELVQQQAFALVKQKLLLQERIQLSHAQVLKLETLFVKQLISNDALTNAKQSLLSLQQQQSQLALQISDVNARKSQLKAQQSQLEQQLAQQSTQTQLNKLPLQQQIGQIKAQQTYTIYAPRDGVISNLHAQLGDDISRFSVLMKLSPKQQSFIAMLAIPTSAAGFIAPEQNVSLKLDAFAFKNTALSRQTLLILLALLPCPMKAKRMLFQFHSRYLWSKQHCSVHLLKPKARTLHLKRV